MYILLKSHTFVKLHFVIYGLDSLKIILDLNGGCNEYKNPCRKKNKGIEK